MKESGIVKDWHKRYVIGPVRLEDGGWAFLRPVWCIITWHRNIHNKNFKYKVKSYASKPYQFKP